MKTLNVIFFLGSFFLSNLIFAQTPSFQYAKQFGNSNSNAGGKIAIDKAGFVYSTGSFSGTMDLDPGVGVFSVSSTGFYSFFITKLTPNGSFVWGKVFNGASSGGINSIALDTAANIYTTGEFTGTADFNPGTAVENLSSNGFSNAAFITKIDSSGNYIWAKKLANTDNTNGKDLKIDSKNNVIITGLFQNTLDFDPNTGVNNLTTLGNIDMFVLKLNSAGNFLWAKRQGGSLSGTNNIINYSLAVDGLNSVYLTGTFDGIINFDPSASNTSLQSIAAKDIFIVKLDSSGHFNWAKRIGYIGDDYARCIEVRNSNLYITGYFAATVDFDPNAGTNNLSSFGNSEDVFVLKLDTASNFIWVKQIGGTSSEYPTKLAIDINENIYVTGGYNALVDFDPSSNVVNLNVEGLQDAFVFKLDANGAFGWARKLGGASNEYPFDVATDLNYNIYLSGMFFNNGDFDPTTGIATLNSFGDFDIYLVKLSQCSTIPAPPTITANSSTSFCNGGNVILTSNLATGNQWYKNEILLSGSTNNTLSVNSTGNYYTKNFNGGCATMPSNIISTTNNAFPSIPVINWNSSVLSTAAGNASYTWYLNNVVISGATTNTYIPTASGIYKVVVSNVANCSSTSADFSLMVTAINNVIIDGTKITKVTSLVSNSIIVKTESNNLNKLRYKLFDSKSNLLLNSYLNNGISEINVNKLPSGIYYLNIIGSKANKNFKIIINK